MTNINNQAAGTSNALLNQVNNSYDFKTLGVSGELFRGIVLDNKDPDRLCRLKVQIPSITGDLPPSGLPWAYPCLPYAGPGYGMCLIPEVGSTVWILFEGSDKTKPVWIGCSYGGSTAKGYRILESAGDKVFKLSDGSWTYKLKEVDTPYEYAVNGGNVQVVYRSPKGAAILVSEEDENEYFQIIDRLGQTIKMYCPTFVEFNEDNQAVRTYGSVEDFDMSDKVHPANAGGYILIQHHAQGEKADSVIKLSDESALITNGDTVVYLDGEIAKLTDIDNKLEISLDKEDDKVRLISRSESYEDPVSVSLDRDNIKMDITDSDDPDNPIQVTMDRKTKEIKLNLKNKTKFKMTEDGIEILGNVTIEGGLKTTEDVVADTISLMNHTHQGVHGITSSPLPEVSDMS